MKPETLEKVRQDFPILRQTVQGAPLIYLDNGATVQKPRPVLEALSDYYTRYNANIHRGSYPIADQATQAFEETRVCVRDLLGAEKKEEIIFTKGTTEAINLVAGSWGERFLSRGDEVLISHLEHHANIVPWQVICEKKGATLRVIPMDEKGQLVQSSYENMLNRRTKMVALTHASNVLGTLNPIQEMAKKAHAVGARVLIDGAQTVGHLKVDVRALGADFYAFSGHKAYAPLGTGVLYGRAEWLDAMPPYQTGGEMVKAVTFQKTTYNALPYKFEAGTPNIGDVIALGAAVAWMNQVGLSTIAAHERALYACARTTLSEIDKLHLLGAPKESVAILSFHMEGVHPYDMGQFLGARGVCVRTGNHCADPVVKFFGLDSTVRMSFAAYNTEEEIETACAHLRAIQKKLAP